MGANIQPSTEPHILPGSQHLEKEQEDTIPARTSKRQKTTHEPEQAAIAARSPTTMSASATPMLETLRLEHVPETHSVHVAVFRDVANAAFLHQQLLARNLEFEYALIDAGVVCTYIYITPISSTKQTISKLYLIHISQASGPVRSRPRSNISITPSHRKNHAEWKTRER